MSAAGTLAPLVLVAEDDPEISAPLLRSLRREGYDVRHVADGPSALAAGLAGGLDLLVLDLGLPGMDGLDVCRALRAGGAVVPVLILTARTGEADLVIGLDAGADDYVGKPFRISELMARVRVQLRRSTSDAHDVITVGALAVDADSRRVTVDDVEVNLTPKEYDLLLLLVRRVGTVVTREVIMREVWHTDWLGATKSIDMHVSTLRRKLGRASCQITTLRGVGLRLERGA